jgi:hypothetical protein
MSEISGERARNARRVINRILPRSTRKCSCEITTRSPFHDRCRGSAVRLHLSSPTHLRTYLNSVSRSPHARLSLSLPSRMKEARPAQFSRKQGGLNQREWEPQFRCRKYPAGQRPNPRRGPAIAILPAWAAPAAADEKETSQQSERQPPADGEISEPGPGIAAPAPQPFPDNPFGPANAPGDRNSQTLLAPPMMIDRFDFTAASLISKIVATSR